MKKYFIFIISIIVFFASCADGYVNINFKNEKSGSAQLSIDINKNYFPESELLNAIEKIQTSHGVKLKYKKVSTDEESNVYSYEIKTDFKNIDQLDAMLNELRFDQFSPKQFISIETKKNNVRINLGNISIPATIKVNGKIENTSGQIISKDTVKFEKGKDILIHYKKSSILMYILFGIVVVLLLLLIIGIITLIMLKMRGKKMKQIKSDLIEKFSNSYANKNLKSLQNSVMKNGILAATYNFEAKVSSQHIFSDDIRTGKVTDQKNSGRCWMFAALNTFRHKLNKDFNLKDFELSQTFTFFYDKLEKSNYFLENIIKTKDMELDSRLVHFLLSMPQQDGGQWDMLVSIIEKYGVVPKSAMPEVFHSTNSVKLNTYLNKKLRQAAYNIRKLNENGESLEVLYDYKQKILDEIYTFLSVSLGQPPKTFDFEYYDEDKKFHRDLGITPKQFYDKYVGIDLSEYISVINAPTKDKPYYKTFTVDFLGNVVGGRQVKYINVPMEDLKKATIAQIQDGVSVWFGCDVGQNLENTDGLMDLNIFDVDNSYGIDFSLTKEQGLDYCESLMTHAMVLSGVNIVDGKPNRWKVENSWGNKSGSEGFYLMTDEWMDLYTYQVVINKKYLPKEIVEKFEQEPIVLNAWDPMGSLAYMK